MARTNLAALATALILSGMAAQRATAETPLHKCIAAQAEKLDFSGVVSISQPTGATTYARGRLAGPGSPEISADTRFNLASAGKMFTAVAVAQLVDSGKVGLDDPIGRYVDGLTPQTAAVTVRQLLTHSSGLGNFFSPENIAAVEKARTASDLLPLVASDKPAYPPGSRFAYSNTGFLLLGVLIERVSGQSYDQYLRQHLFEPTGMTASGLEPGPTSQQAVGMTRMPEFLRTVSKEGSAHEPPHLLQPGASGFPPPGPLRPSPEAALRGNPAGGSFSTAGDMQRFFVALLGGRLTSAAMLKMLASAQIVAMPAKGGMPQLDYGLGFGVGAFQGHRWFGHNGGAPGVNTEATAYPDDQATLIVMANRDPPVATSLFRQLRATLFDPSRCG